jgi:HEAT repeat protein
VHEPSRQTVAALSKGHAARMLEFARTCSPQQAAVLELLAKADRFVLALFGWAGAVALITAIALLGERTLYWLGDLRRQWIRRWYGPLVRHALDGDALAIRKLRSSASRHRIFILQLLIAPLYAQHDPGYAERARVIFDALAGGSLAHRLLSSRRWWRRAMALRSLGVLQVRAFTPAVVAALDDPHPEVRAVALDALADLRDPSSLQALVVRLHDETLNRHRCLTAIAAFGTDGESLLLDLARMDAQHRRGYAVALAICGTKRALPLLCDLTQDPAVDVRVAALTAIGQVGLDDRATGIAMEALTSEDVDVRRAAAHTLRLATENADAATRLVGHLGDAWPVAVEAARSLRSIGATGISALREAAAGQGLAGLLARQMLWDGPR